MPEKKAILPGTITVCHVERGIETGYVLRKNGLRILIHNDELSGTVKKGEDITVFLYENKAGDMEATMNLPEINLNSYGWGEVTHVLSKAGVFVHIGTKKDVLVSKDDLPENRKEWPQAKDKLYVILSHDRHERLIAKPVREETIRNQMETANDTLKHQTTEGHVYRIIEEGTLFVSKEGYRCFIHHTMSNKPHRLGQFISGKVVDVREDGTLNVSTLPAITERQLEDADLILNYLIERNGKMPVTDKTPPDIIQDTLGLSKAAFKRAMGKLLKEKRVKQEDGFTFLLDEKQ